MSSPSNQKLQKITPIQKLVATTFYMKVFENYCNNENYTSILETFACEYTYANGLPQPCNFKQSYLNPIVNFLNNFRTAIDRKVNSPGIQQQIKNYVNNLCVEYDNAVDMIINHSSTPSWFEDLKYFLFTFPEQYKF